MVAMKRTASGRRASLLGPSVRKVVTSRTAAAVGIPTRPEAVLVLRVREGGAKLIGRGIGREIPIGRPASGEHIAHGTADHVHGESMGVDPPHECCDVLGYGGAECRLVAHAPLAVTPSPMKRKSRHAE